MKQQTRFLIVGFDGLRPDCVKEDMPALHRFIEHSHRWSQYCANFPTETYVNHPTIFSGFRPCDHGIIANCFYDKLMPAHQSIFTGWSVQSISEQEGKNTGYGVIEIPSLGDRLGQQKKTLRVLCANSSGSTRLQHIHADRYEGHLNCCVHDIDSALPLKERECLQSRWGSGIPLAFPDFKGNELLCDIFFNYEIPRGLGDVTVLWFGEPDHSSHEFGIWHDKTRQARQNADQAFEKILHWWESEGKDAGVQLVTMSDHGHSEIAEHFDATSVLKKAGFSVLTGTDIRKGANPQDADIVAVGSYAIGLWINPEIQDKIDQIRDVLMQTPEVGMIFSQPSTQCPPSTEGSVAGTFSEHLLSSDHRRGPDLRIVLHNDPQSGYSIDGGDIDIGCGNHGGLMPCEIRAVLAIGGNRFSAAPKEHQVPAAHDDFAMTVMTLLGLLDQKHSDEKPLKARVLKEALCGEQTNSSYALERLSLQYGKYSQYLIRAHYCGCTYVLEGAREDTHKKHLIKDVIHV